MKTIEIAWKNFEMNEIAHKFLENYLERVASFVKKNDIESDLYQDILQGLSDKLSDLQKKWQTITEKDCINIINQIGEPEDIFGEEENNNEEYSSNKKHTKKGEQKFFEELRDNWRERDEENCLFLGVSWVIAKKIGIPTIAIRTLFLVLVPFYMASFWLYLLLGILFPAKGKTYDGVNSAEYIAGNILWLRKYIAKGLRNILGFAKKCIWRWYELLVLLFGRVGNLIKIIFLIMVEIGFIRAGFGLLCVTGGLLVGITYDNIDFINMFPWYTSVASIIWVYSIAIFVILIGQNLLKKAYLKQIFVLSAIFWTIVSTLGFISTGYHVFNNFSEHFTKTQKIEIPLSGENTKITLKLDYISNKNFRINMEDTKIYFYTTSGNKIQIETENTIRTRDKEIADTIFTNMSTQTATQEWATITVQNEWDKAFKEKTPFSLIEKKIKIYIPTNIQVKIENNQENKISNVKKTDKQEKYGHYLWYRDICDGAYIWYSNKDNGFICESDFSKNNYVIRRYMEDKLSEKSDEITPLKLSLHSDDESNHRDAHSFNRIDNNTVSMKVSDRYLNIFMKLKVTETENGVSIQSNTVSEVEQKGLLKQGYYKNIEMFDSYKLKYKDTPEEID